MSDLFSNIYRGIRQPTVSMNEGPLPPMDTSSGYPSGFNGTPDARINQANTLLGDGSVDPYAYGESDRLSTQTAYLNIPHAAYRIVPPINLPDHIGPKDAGASTFMLSHQVDDGDIAFVIRAMYTPHEIIQNKGKYARQGVLHSIDPVCNLATVNYILHGIQRYGYDPANIHWNTLWIALGLDSYFHDGTGQGSNSRGYGSDGKLTIARYMKELHDQIREAHHAQKLAKEEDDMQVLKILAQRCCLRECRKRVSEYLIKEVIRPFGVPRGSEKQGGQHQGLVNKSVTWPVDLVTSVLIDGKVINLVNYWRQENINAGDDLMLHLAQTGSTEYTLSHHPKSYRKLKFPPLGKWSMPKLPSSEIDSETFFDDLGELAFTRMGQLFLSVIDTEQNQNNFNERVQTALFDGVDDLKSFLPVVASARKLSTWISRITKKDYEFQTFVQITEPLWQLVPGVYNSSKAATCAAIWKRGYWHIARCQTMQFAYDGTLDISAGGDNGGASTSGKLLEATFAPMWIPGLGTGSSSSVNYAGPFTNGLDSDETLGKRKRSGESSYIWDDSTLNGIQKFTRDVDELINILNSEQRTNNNQNRRTNLLAKNNQRLVYLSGGARKRLEKLTKQKSQVRKIEKKGGRDQLEPQTGENADQPTDEEYHSLSEDEESSTHNVKIIKTLATEGVTVTKLNIPLLTFTLKHSYIFKFETLDAHKQLYKEVLKGKCDIMKREVISYGTKIIKNTQKLVGEKLSYSDLINLENKIVTLKNSLKILGANFADISKGKVDVNEIDANNAEAQPLISLDEKILQEESKLRQLAVKVKVRPSTTSTPPEVPTKNDDPTPMENQDPLREYAMTSASEMFRDVAETAANAAKKKSSAALKAARESLFEGDKVEQLSSSAKKGKRLPGSDQ